MLSLTTVITDTGRPLDSMPGSVRMSMTLVPGTCRATASCAIATALSRSAGLVAGKVFLRRAGDEMIVQEFDAGARSCLRAACPAALVFAFTAMAFVPPRGMLLRAIVADRTRLATRNGARLTRN